MAMVYFFCTEASLIYYHLCAAWRVEINFRGMQNNQIKRNAISFVHRQARILTLDHRPEAQAIRNDLV
ncbi:hypothetical protein SCA6_007370 [Theobroma cacao]